MKTKEYSSLGLKVPFQVPESIEEFNSNAKRPDACLDEATNNVVYRGCLADFRSLFLYGQDEDKENNQPEVLGVAQHTKIEPELEEKGKRKDGTAIMGYKLSDQKYFDKVCAATQRTPESFQALATEIAALIEFDASATERKGPGVVKLGKNWLDAASQLLDKGDFTKFGKNYHKFVGKPLVLPTFGDDKVKNVNLLARLLKEMYDAKEKSELAASSLV